MIYKFKKNTKEQKMWIEIDKKEIELKTQLSHGKPISIIKDYVEGRQYLSFGKLEKENEWCEINLDPREQVSRGGGYLTDEEKNRIAELENEIKEIKENAKKRRPMTLDSIKKLPVNEQKEYLKKLLADLDKKDKE